MVASISSIKFNDLDFKEVQDEGEAGLENFAIELIDSTGEVIAFNITNTAGFYEFTDLEPVFDTVVEELANILPEDSGWYYNGSLTTPPFSEVLDRFLFEGAIEVSPEQIEVFADFFASIDLESNNRDLQDINGRQFNELNFQLTLEEESVTEHNFANTPVTEVAGGEEKDTLTGTEAFDLILAGDEADKLYGFAGNDTLEGDAGRDTLSGGAGNDILTGGSEQDMFVLAAGNDADFITDFEPGTDFFHLADDLIFEDLSFAGNSILLDETSEILATVANLDTTTLTAGDFLTVYTPLQCCTLIA